MDWSKAKTILIAALLITNLILGGFYLKKHSETEHAEETAVRNAVAYAQKMNIRFPEILPKSVDRLPVLFVSFRSEADPQIHSYKGYSVEAPGLAETEVIPEEEGEASGRLITVSSAILKFLNGIFAPAAADRDLFSAEDLSMQPAGDLSMQPADEFSLQGAEDPVLQISPEGKPSSVLRMELVYVVYDADTLGSALEDTAVPAWKFVTDSGDYYVKALFQ